MKVRLIFIIILLATRVCFSQEAGASLKLYHDARAIALAGAYTSLCEGASSLYWNPAALGFMERFSTTLSHSQWIAYTAYNYLGLCTNVKDIPIGISLMYINIGNIPEAIETPTGGKLTGHKFSFSDFVFCIGGGKKLKEKLSVGGTLKILRENVGKLSAAYRNTYPTAKESYNAVAFGIDAGVMYKINPQLIASFVGQNIVSSELRLDKEGFPLVRIIRTGLAYKLPTESKKLTELVLAGGLEYADEELKLAVGSEFELFETLNLRVGYDSSFGKNRYGEFKGIRVEGLSLGLGIEINRVAVDYAWVAYGDFGDTHRFSVSMNF